MLGGPFKKKLRNLICAIKALRHIWCEELSFRMQALFGLATIMLAFALHLSQGEWLFVILAIGAVLAVESLNTAIEELCDVVTHEHHVRIGIIKDLGALASALTGCAALVVGLIIFLPKLLTLTLI